MFTPKQRKILMNIKYQEEAMLAAELIAGSPKEGSGGDGTAQNGDQGETNADSTW